MKYILGLTGQTGAGKSTVCEIAEKNGFFVIDCDRISHSVTNRKGPALDALVKTFGKEILNDSGNLDRKKLAEAAFSSRENTELLNKTVLPFIKNEILMIIEKSNSDKILLDAPTLFESGLNKICSDTVCVLANRQTRRERIIKRDSLSEHQADMRLDAGKNDKFYIENSGHTVYNDGDITTVLDSFKKILKEITEV